MLEKRESKAGLVGEFYLDPSLYEKYVRMEFYFANFKKIHTFEAGIKFAAKYKAPIYIECNKTDNFVFLKETLEFINGQAEGKEVKLVLWNLVINP